MMEPARSSEKSVLSDQEIHSVEFIKAVIWTWASLGNMWPEFLLKGFIERVYEGSNYPELWRLYRSTSVLQ